MFSNPEKILIQFGVGSGTYIADFGAGNGFYATLLSEKVGETGKVFCIDVSRDMLHKLAKEAENRGVTNIEAVWGDVEKDNGTSLAKESVDAVIIANTLFAMEHKDKVAEEAKRILRPKGRVLVVEWSDSFAGMGPHQDHVVKQDEAMKIFETAGFAFEREVDAGDHHYGLVWRKG